MTLMKIGRQDALAQSADQVSETIQRLERLFPGLVTEGSQGKVVDVDVLRQLVGDHSVSQCDEKYGLNWHGKQRARHQSLTPSAGTLLPCMTESVDWATTKNVFIEGDNLEVLKLLQKSYAGKVKLIYIDPPYNTGNDLLYPNDFHDGIRAYLEVTGQMDGGAKLVSNPETSGRYHTEWLNMMYPRLRLARNLLRRDDGVLICTIDEHEQANLGVLLKEVFNEGSYEHVCVTIVHNPRGVQGTNFSYTHEYAYFVYPRGVKAIGDRKIEEGSITWSQFRNWGSESERADARNCFYPVLVKDGRVVGFGDVCADDVHPGQTEWSGDAALVYPIDRAGTERKWRYARQSVEAIAHLLRAKQTERGYEIEIGKDFGQYKTVWADKRFDANEYGTGIVGALVPDSPFTFPKSLWAVYECLYAVVGDDKDAIVVDFFAGSGTTGHAVFELNKNDGGSRRFILAQLPEPIEDPKYRTIADVTKTRLRSAAASSRAEAPLVSGDYGFRVFKLAQSNIRAWEPNRDTIEDSLLEQADHLVPGRTEQDVLYELLLKLGLDLAVPIEQRTIAGKTVHSVGGGVLLVCLAEQVARDEVEPLALGIASWHAELAPAGEAQVVVRDSAFADDVAKTNLVAILQQHGLENVRSL